MKRLTFATSLVILLAVAAFAQPKTVTDFYLAMPADVYSTTISGEKFKTKAELIKFRRSLIKVEDVKNGYLKLEGPWEGWAEIALFKRKDGSYLIAESSVGCGPACDGSLKLFTYTAGKWTDVTTRFAPKVTNAAAFKAYKANGGTDSEIDSPSAITYYYLLPREGRTLKVSCNTCDDNSGDFTLLEYEWNGTAFVAK